MDKVRKLWIPVLSGVVLIAIMVGVVGAVGNNRPSMALGPTAYITVPAAAFNPDHEGVDWQNWGNQIINQSANSWYFLAGPIVFPHSGTVQITEISFVAWDDSGGQACAYVFRNLFSAGGTQIMGSVCSTGSAASVRRFTTTSISPARVNPKWYGCYVRLLLPASSAVTAYSVRITYRPVL